MTIFICMVILLCCLYFIRLDLSLALDGRPYSVFSIIVFSSLIFYYLLPLALFYFNPAGPWKFLSMIGYLIQPTDLTLISFSLFIVTLSLGLARLASKPFHISRIHNIRSSTIDNPSRPTKLAIYANYFIATIICVYTIYSSGGLLSFLIGGKLVKTGTSDLSYSALILRYLLPLIYFQLMITYVRLTGFYQKRLYLIPIFLVIGLIVALSSGSRGQIIGFMLTNAYLYIVFKLSGSKFSLQKIILPFRTFSIQPHLTVYLSVRKLVITAIFILVIAVTVVFLPYLKSLLWVIGGLGSDFSFDQVLNQAFLKQSLFMQSRYASDSFFDHIVLFYSSLDHPLASFIAMSLNLHHQYLPTHQLDLVDALKSLITESDSGVDTPSSFFQSLFQRYTVEQLGRVPPGFLAASIFYHTKFLFVPITSFLFFIFTSFDLYVSRFRSSLSIPLLSWSISRAFVFVWACIFPLAIFNYLFIPDWFMSIYKILPFALFTLPLIFLMNSHSRTYP